MKFRKAHSRLGIYAYISPPDSARSTPHWNLLFSARSAPTLLSIIYSLFFILLEQLRCSLLVVFDVVVAAVAVLEVGVICAALRCTALCACVLVKLFAELVKLLLNFFGLCLDVTCGTGVLDGTEVVDLRTDSILCAVVNLVAHFVEQLFGLVNNLVGVVADVDFFSALCVLGSVLLSILDGSLDVLLVHGSGGGDGDVLLLAGALVSCGNVDNAVCVYIKCDFDLRNTSACGSNAVEVEYAEQLVVSGEFTLALQNLDFNGSLVVGLSRYRAKGE